MLQMKSNSSLYRQMVKTRPKNKPLKKKQPRKKATEWVAHEEPSSRKPNKKEFSKIDGNTTSYSIHGIKPNARIRVKQDIDLVLKNLELKIISQLLTTDDSSTTKQTKIVSSSKMDCYYGKITGRLVTSNITNFFIAKQLVDEALRSLHGEFGKHPAITKTIIAYRQKYYYPNMAKLIR